ncbi:MAG: iron-sulfur cluster assembly accessory protein [Myxococcaceae bacterium]|nr:iron-sulfur cluster assembly accessory protein [Myxococcaceae bacterium]MBH2006157.1 iron-sulfur cluster assembly accessory protein [Myxococcaceae bacterium]
MSLLSIKRKKAIPLNPSFEAMPPLDASRLGITPAALQKLQNLLLAEPEASYFRVGLQGGGCSGLKPLFAIEKFVRESDHVIQEDSVTVCIDPRSMALLGGSWLDFDQGFKIQSPAFKRSCSCGESFSV